MVSNLNFHHLQLCGPLHWMCLNGGPIRYSQIGSATDQELIIRTMAVNNGRKDYNWHSNEKLYREFSRLFSIRSWVGTEPISWGNQEWSTNFLNLHNSWKHDQKIRCLGSLKPIPWSIRSTNLTDRVGSLVIIHNSRSRAHFISICISICRLTPPEGSANVPSNAWWTPEEYSRTRNVRNINHGCALQNTAPGICLQCMVITPCCVGSTEMKHTHSASYLHSQLRRLSRPI